MSERIGFYICHCGINIAYRVRVREVAEYVALMPNVAVSRDYLFMCSDPGQELIEKDIRAHRLTRVVVASCSPRMHEKTFRAACERGGLNPYRAFHMVSVRENVSWVTEDEEAATRKAKILAGAGVMRVIRQQDLEPSTFSVCTHTLVVGGGIAGMQASLDIARAGFKVYLVERQPTIGGHMLQYDKTFPTLDCAACIGTPKMVSVGQHPNIELLSCSEIQDVKGFIGNFKVTVRKKARYVESRCTGCGECEKVCPVTIPNEWDVGTRLRKAIYRPFPQAVPITYCIDKLDRAPCVQSCPANVNVQGYVTMAREGNDIQAVRVLMEHNPLPRSVSRICPAPCEKVCRRGKVDEPLAVRRLGRFVTDRVDVDQIPVPDIAPKPAELKMAVVGSGPAGLSCAYFLAREGYPVTVFEALPEPGGSLRVKIPDFRLPAAAVADDIHFLQKLGVTLVTRHEVGKEESIEDLFSQGFKAVFVAVGLHRDLPLKMEGADGAGVMPAGEYLRRVRLNESLPDAGRVVVIGGSSMAVDAARTALRRGASEVTLVFNRIRKGREAMPAEKDALSSAEAEGVRILADLSPLTLISDQGRVTGLTCGPAPDAVTLSCDLLIPALGQGPSASVYQGVKGIKVTSAGVVSVDAETFQTGRAGLFAGGEAVAGAGPAIRSVAAGRAAAVSMDRFAQGMDLKESRPKKPRGTQWAALPEKASAVPQAPMPMAEPNVRNRDFREIELGFPEPTARSEAARCLSCGICCECGLCVQACEAKAVRHGMIDEVETLDVGSIIVATGFDVMDPTPMSAYGYGVYANVFTNLEFERLSNATGPTGGKLLKRDPADRLKFTDPPRSVAILHCIGSRDIHYHEYCSRTCCMYALKYAHLLKDKCGHDTRIYNFYIDMRCFGKGYEEFYKRVQKEGVRMIRGKAARVTEKDGMLEVAAEDTLSDSMVTLCVDMVILCTAMEARKDVTEVARVFGISTGADGFFMEEHPKLEPVSTASSGVFLAGACQGPKDIPDTVAQAKGAAAEALALSAAGKVSVSPMISWIDPDICIGCKICIGLCPYSAIEFNERKGISVVNEAVCKGCGSCSAYCPSGAAKVKQFTDRQIFAEIDGLMAG